MEIGLRREPGRAAQLLRHEARGPERGRRPAVHHRLHRCERRHGASAWPTTRACTRPRTSRIPATTPRPPSCPCWSPPIPPECLAFTKLAYELSEQFDTPVLLNMCTRVAHSQSVVEPGERMEPPQSHMRRTAPKYIMMPWQRQAPPSNGGGAHRRSLSPSARDRACQPRGGRDDHQIGIITSVHQLSVCEGSLRRPAIPF